MSSLLWFQLRLHETQIEAECTHLRLGKEICANDDRLSQSFRDIDRYLSATIILFFSASRCHENTHKSLLIHFSSVHLFNSLQERTSLEPTFLTQRYEPCH